MHVIIPFKGAIVAQGTYKDIVELLPSLALASESQAKQGDDDDDQQHEVCHSKDSMVRVMKLITLELEFRNGTFISKWRIAFPYTSKHFK